LSSERRRSPRIETNTVEHHHKTLDRGGFDTRTRCARLLLNQREGGTAAPTRMTLPEPGAISVDGPIRNIRRTRRA